MVLDIGISLAAVNFAIEKAKRLEAHQHLPDGNPPIELMTEFQCIKKVRAGLIREVREDGCMVMVAGSQIEQAVFRAFKPGMTARRMPCVGDFWVAYDNGYEAISPRDAFADGYIIESDPVVAPQMAIIRRALKQPPICYEGARLRNASDEIRQSQVKDKSP